MPFDLPGIPAILPHLIRDAARRAQVPEESVEPVSCEAIDWGDSSLGCRRAETAVLTAVVPGYCILLRVRGADFEYHTSRPRDDWWTNEGRPVPVAERLQEHAQILLCTQTEDGPVPARLSQEITWGGHPWMNPYHQTISPPTSD